MARQIAMALMWVTLPTVAPAQDVKRMDTVVVTATNDGLRLDESASNGALGNRAVLDTPFSVTVIDSEDISRRQATSVAQIFINDRVLIPHRTLANVGFESINGSLSMRINW